MANNYGMQKGLWGLKGIVVKRYNSVMDALRDFNTTGVCVYSFYCINTGDGLRIR